MNRRALSGAVAAAAMLAAAGPAAGYSFSIPEATLEVFVQPDASIRLVYEITFENRGRAIDVVDIGLPHKGYSVSTMRASVDGTALPRIARSTYISIGVEVALGSHAIGRGRTGTFRFEATMPDMVYRDTTRHDYASLRITPTWFDSSLLRGRTRLTVAIHVPEGVEADAVLHQGEAFTDKALYQDRVVAVWQRPDHRMDGPYMVGLSFPSAGMERVVVLTRWQLLSRWWESAPGVRLIVGLLLSIAFTVVFFRLSGGTGWSVYIVLIVGVNIWFVASASAQLIVTPIFAVTLVLMETYKRRRRRKYLPPIASVEGGGIKRGLTAPEAAVLLELPLGKVLTLVLFGMLKKGLVEMTGSEPLRLQVHKELWDKNRKERLKAAGRLGVVLHTYEHSFLDELVKLIELDVAAGSFGPALRALVNHTADRIGGFDAAETRAYYRAIVSRAWKEAESLGQVEARTEVVDRNLEWLLLDDRYERRFDTWSTGGYRYQPVWVRGGGGGGGGAPASARGGAGGTGLAAPRFSDVAASFAGWTENVTGRIAQSISPGAVSLRGGKGVLDLSGFDKVTSGFFEAMAAGGSGGGSSGGSSCACAGCACACACAGGGR